MAAVTGASGSIARKTTASATVMGNEACTEVSGTRFQITNAAKRYIDKTQNVVVRVDTVTQTSGYSIEYAGGFVVFDSSKTGQTVDVSAYYWTMETAAQFFNWELDIQQDALDATDFGDGGWKVFITGIKSGTASAEAYYINDEWMNAPGNAGSTATSSQPVKFYLDGDAHYEGYFVVDGITIDTPADEIIKSTISFTSDGPFYYRDDD